jgi:hypothetical protein
MPALANLISLLSFNGAAFLSSPPAPGAECTRAMLKAHTDTYVSAQTQGKLEPVLAMAGDALSYTEDMRPLDPKTGQLTKALKIDHHRSIYDTKTCATYTEAIAADPSSPRVLGTQMHFDAGSGKLTSVATLVTQPGDWLFNASATLQYAAMEDGKWGSIPEGQRDKREVIQAAADAYLDLFNNKSVVVPWGMPCRRLEGGIYTGSGAANDTCAVGVPDGINITQRRYVIDEELGAVDAFVMFATRPDSHEFRVEKGKIVAVHTLTIMRNLTTTHS